MSGSALDRAEWERRYIVEFERLCLQTTTATQMFSPAEARELAHCDLEGAGYDFLSEGFEDNPEAAAAESVCHYSGEGGNA